MTKVIKNIGVCYELTTLFIGRNLIKLPETESTNRFLSTLSGETNLFEGTVVLTGYQTSGRGQAEAKWTSDSGQNLLMSVLLKPDFLATKKIFLLSKIVSLAIKDALLDFNIKTKIKWPNDIYSGNNKICGVLIENIMRGIQVQQSVIGIGLNVNQEVFPREIPNPVSMKLISGDPISIDECLFSICNHLEKRYLLLKSDHVTEINKEYLNSLYRFHEMYEYEAGSKRFKAEIIDVEDEGRVVMKKEDGSVIKFGFKEVR